MKKLKFSFNNADEPYFILKHYNVDYALSLFKAHH